MCKVHICSNDRVFQCFFGQSFIVADPMLGQCACSLMTSPALISSFPDVRRHSVNKPLSKDIFLSNCSFVKHAIFKLECQGTLLAREPSGWRI